MTTLMVWHLVPIEPGHLDWEASNHRGPCLVCATTEEEARSFAMRAFIMLTPVRLGQNIRNCPWDNPKHVSCAVAELAASIPDLRAGEIMIPDGHGWRRHHNS